MESNKRICLPGVLGINVSLTMLLYHSITLHQSTLFVYTLCFMFVMYVVNL